ncbi:MAG: response regulator [Anaeromusa sp.]|uniref:response regulator n=1 Tax=Anaeromusa sp. TaxID=1872520 RepID=UPI002B212E4E|nr:response regulator [Anaeromusa sp.]MEA4835840.1 response regulator [Anaeromusa sp.]
MNEQNQPWNILVVDDDRFSRAILINALEKDGYICREAKDGVEAVEMYQEQPPDLILMDVEMPRMGGVEACRRIRELEDSFHVMILFITGHDESSDTIEQAFAAGGDDYLLKPVNLVVMRQRLGRLLEHSALMRRILFQNDMLLQMRQISFDFLQERDVQATLGRVLQQSLRLTASALGSVYLLDEKENCMRLAVQEGMPMEPIAACISRGRHMVGRAWEQAEPFFVNDYSIWEDRLQGSSWSDLCHMAALPLTRGGVVFGVMVLGRRREQGEFTEARKNVLVQLADLLALVVDDARIMEALEEEVKRRECVQREVEETNGELSLALTTLQQAQSKLVQQEKLAGVGQLAAGVAHEINNPLGFVSSNFSMLQRYVERLCELIEAYKNALEQAEVEEAVQEIAAGIREKEKSAKLELMLEDLPELFEETKDGIERIGKIVKALRVFSRVDSLEQFGEYDLNSGLDTTLIVARNEIKYVAKIEKKLAPLPMIQAIGSQINQVLLNFLVNAAQAIQSEGREGQGLIRIQTSQEDGWVRCSIYNDGPPIPENIRHRLFEPFFTTKPVGKGTGLGLSISYEIIVQKHHGEIFFTSGEGGTEFVLRLPIMQSDDTVAAIF